MVKKFRFMHENLNLFLRFIKIYFSGKMLESWDDSFVVVVVVFFLAWLAFVALAWMLIKKSEVKRDIQ